MGPNTTNINLVHRNMAFPSTSSSSYLAADADLSQKQGKFKYDEDVVIEVLIIDNGDDDRDGYVELANAAKIITPLTNVRGFNKSVLWTNTIPSQRLIRNNINYIHVFALGKYLSSYNLNSNTKPPQYHLIKRLISDLLMGVQSNVVDPLNDIKTQLCTLQECLVNSSNSANNMDTVLNNGQIYHSTTISNDTGNNGIDMLTVSWSDIMKNLIRSEHSSLLSNINATLDTLKTMHVDLVNKLAFSNDTMLDSFKSIKDIIIRKK